MQRRFHALVGVRAAGGGEGLDRGAGQVVIVVAGQFVASGGAWAGRAPPVREWRRCGRGWLDRRRARPATRSAAPRSSDALETAEREIPDPRVRIRQSGAERGVHAAAFGGAQGVRGGGAVARGLLAQRRQQRRERARLVQVRQLLDGGAPHLFVRVAGRVDDGADAFAETEIAGDPDRAVADARVGMR